MAQVMFPTSKRNAAHASGTCSSLDRGTSALLDQVKEASLDIPEQRRRGKPITEDPGRPGNGATPSLGHSSTLCSDTTTQLGASSSSLSDLRPPRL